MKFAYADPPYLGCGRLYAKHHAEALIWDDPKTHQALVERLVVEFLDGWALSLSSPSLRTILPMCPPDVRIGFWGKSFVTYKKGVRPCYASEPLIYWRGRNPPRFKHAPPEKGGKATTPKDFIVCPITLKKGLTGAKPEKFCEWVLELLNVQPGDEVHDLFPGTGIMGRVAERVTAPTWLR
jgi:hypothetical protein